MEAQYTCRNGRLVIKVEAGDQKSLFQRIAETEEVFDAATSCGMCNCTDLAFRVRTVDGNDFYEMACRKCRATMSFGQHRAGNTLFPKHNWQRFGDEPIQPVGHPVQAIAHALEPADPKAGLIRRIEELYRTKTGGPRPAEKPPLASLTVEQLKEIHEYLEKR